MAGITHEWDGAVLTVTSDAGTSSANLQGPKGDVGPRGPQGPAGVIYNEDGELVLDLSMYATYEDMEAAIENIDVDLSDYPTELEVANTLNNYATKNYVSTQIAQAQLEGAEVDLSGYATLDQLNAITVNTDDLTIVKDANTGAIKTAIGGYIIPSEPVVEYGSRTSSSSNWHREFSNADTEVELGTIPSDINILADTKYLIRVYGKNASGAVSNYTDVSCYFTKDSNGNYVANRSSGYGWFSKLVYYPSTHKITGFTNEYCYMWYFRLVKATYYGKINVNCIPIDDDSIKVVNGMLTLSNNLTNFYTKEEIDNLLANISSGALPSSEEVPY